jgi:hypothetical protein
MQVSQRALAAMLLWSLLCGSALGLVYDFLILLCRSMGPLPPFLTRLRERLSLPPPLRLKRQKEDLQPGKKRKWGEMVVLFWQDVLVCLLFSVTTVLLLYYTNDGQWRFSVPICMLLAFWAYRVTLGRPLRFVLLLVRMLVSALLVWSTALLVYPFRWLWRRLEKPRQALYGRFLGLYRRILSAMEQSKQKRRDRRQSRRTPSNVTPPPAPQRQRKPHDGKRVFASGGYKQ